MPAYQYLAVPFIGTTKDGRNASIVAGKLTAVINSHAADGWEFMQMTDVKIEVKPGCLSLLFGGSSSYAIIDHLIFRRPV